MSTIKSADKKPEKFVKPDGKVGIRMVPVDKQVVKTEGGMKRIATTQSNKADRMASTDKKGLETFRKMRKKTDEKYRPPTQAEIDADKKKDRNAQRAAGQKRPSMTLKSLKKKQYGGMMGGLKKESVEHLTELDAKTQKNFATGAKNMKAYAQKFGGVDKKDFMEVAKLLDQIGRVNLLQAGQLLSRLNRLVDGMDTDVRERIYIELKKVGLVENYSSEYKHHVQGRKDAEADMKSAKSNADMVKAMNKKQHHDKALSKMNRMESTEWVCGKCNCDPCTCGEITEKLKVSDGMGSWIKDFQGSDAPQFKGKSDKDRRDMAIAAYLSAKRGQK